MIYLMRIFIYILLFIGLINPASTYANVLGREAFQAIEKARTQLETGNYKDAQKQANKIIAASRTSDYERAIARQLLASALAAQDDYKGAIAVLKKIETSPALPLPLQNDVIYHLAQLYLSDDNAALAFSYLEKWFGRIKGKPAASAYALKAYVHFALEEWQAAHKAIATALKEQTSPPKNWLQIQIALYLTQEDYIQVRPILEQAVSLYATDKTLWQQLAAVYDALGEEALVFATYKNMHQQNMLESADEQVRMARLYLYHNNPLAAAHILETGLAAETIKKTDDHYGLLAQAYQLAREWEKSLAPLKQAALLSDKGAYYLQLGFAHSHNEEWQKAITAFEAALKKGVATPADTYLRLGLAYMQSGDDRAAIKALRRAGDDDALAAQAFQWIRIIEARLKNPN